MARRFGLGVVFVIIAAASSTGCFLQFTLGVSIAETLGDEIELSISAIQTGATTAICQVDPFFSPNFHQCTYFINGEPVASTTQLLSEGGVFGVLVDPIVLELPADVTDIGGTFSGGGAAGELVVYPNLSFVPIDQSRTLQAGPGKQFAILDLPEGVPVAGSA